MSRLYPYTIFRKNKYTMLVGLVIFVFIVLLVTAALAGILFLIARQIGIVPALIDRRIQILLIFLMIVSVIIGTILTAVLGRLQLHPYHKLTEATRKIASGNFDVRLDLHGPIELKRLAYDFNHMAKELSSIETLRSDFVSNISHEFKTPVISIKGFAKLLKKDTISEEKRNEYLDIIIQESERLSKLAGNVLLLSKLENQNISEETTVFSIDEQLRRSVLMLEPKWRKNNIHFNIKLKTLYFHGIEELWQQVWINILDNAIKFSVREGQISMTSHIEKERRRISVLDNGIGMDNETASHIFDKFYQGDKSHATEGNGLGLSLVKHIVELSHGTILVDSNPGKGTEFTIELPNDDVQQHYRGRG